MKIKTLILITLLVTVCPRFVLAACINQYNQPAEISDILANYTAYATNSADEQSTGLYELCFDPAYLFGSKEAIQKNITINVSVGHALKIKDLKFPAQPNLGANDSLLILNGPNITLENVTLTGNGSGTAIQVNATDVTIKDSTIFKFAEGIKLAVDAEVKLEDNVYAAIVDKGVDNVKNIFIAPRGAVSPIDETLLGKHISDDDATKVDDVKGKLNLRSCSGEIVMLKRLDELEQFNYGYALQKHSTANCVIETNIRASFKRGEEQTLACGFKCDNFTEDLSTQVVFVYTDDTGSTKPFAPIPLKTFNDLPNVISVMGPMTIFDSGSEANGENNDGAIIVTGAPPSGLPGDCVGDDCLVFDPAGDGKTQTGGDEKISGGGSAAASAGGCGGGQSIVDSKASMLQIIAVLIPLLAIPPLVYCRNRRKR